MPFGSLANASSVGAKTVKGPVPDSVSTRPAAWTAATSVLNDPAPTAVWTMSISFGRSTVSMTWITPLLAAMSALMTWALSIMTLPSVTTTARSCP